MLAAIDAARGLISRSRWIERAIERDLASAGVVPAEPPAVLGKEPPPKQVDWTDPAAYGTRPAARTTGGRGIDSTGRRGRKR